MEYRHSELHSLRLALCHLPPNPARRHLPVAVVSHSLRRRRRIASIRSVQVVEAVCISQIRRSPLSHRRCRMHVFRVVRSPPPYQFHRARPSHRHNPAPHHPEWVAPRFDPPPRLLFRPVRFRLTLNIRSQPIHFLPTCSHHHNHQPITSTPNPHHTRMRMRIPSPQQR